MRKFRRQQKLRNGPKGQRRNSGTNAKYSEELMPQLSKINRFLKAISEDRRGKIEPKCQQVCLRQEDSKEPCKRKLKFKNTKHSYRSDMKRYFPT